MIAEAEDMAHPPVGAQARLTIESCRKQFVGMQAALHDGIDIARARHAAGGVGGGMAVVDLDDWDATEVFVRLRRRRGDPGRRTDQHREDQLRPERLHGAAQGGRVAGMDNGGPHRLALGGKREQSIELRARRAVAPRLIRIRHRLVHSGAPAGCAARSRRDRDLEHAVALV
jgi:hypothetical protein